MIPTLSAHTVAAAAFFIVSSANVLAYQPGEAVAPQVLEQLGIQPGKIVVVDFFAEWCGSCRKELPLIAQLNSRTDDGTVQFVGVDTDDSLAVAQSFQQEMKEKGALNFPVVNDIEQTLVGQFRPKGFPALYIIKDGRIARAHLGAIESIDSLIEQDLQQLTHP